MIFFYDTALLKSDNVNERLKLVYTGFGIIKFGRDHISKTQTKVGNFLKSGRDSSQI